MSGIDNRIVVMTFDNARFERNLAATLASLDELSKSISLVGAKEGLTELGEAAGQADLSPMAAAVENISSKFSILGVVGFTVIQELTAAALDFANRTAAALIDPVISGGRQRATNIEQAMFLFRGLGMDIEAAMDSARTAVLGTAYGLDSAAKAAAQLGGSGLQAGDEMTSALRGIAGIAAMTNTSYDEMADIFIAAAGKGRVMSNELARISHRGVNAAAALANVWGITESEVRQMASEGQISFEMFYQAMDQAFGEHATKANETYVGSLANVRAALSRVGASFFGPHMEQQRDLFNALMPVIDNVHTAIKPLIDTIIQLKGFSTIGIINFLRNIDLTNLEKSIPNFSRALEQSYRGIREFLETIKRAFRDIFPESDVSILVKVSELFLTLSNYIKMGGRTLESVRSIFKGFFSVIAIGFEILKEAGKLLWDFVSALVDAMGFDGGGVLRFFANLGESLTDLKERLVDGGGIAAFFDRIRNVSAPSMELVTKIIDRLRERLGMMRDVVQEAGGVWSGLTKHLSGVFDVLSAIWGHIRTWFSELGSKLADAMTAGDFKAVLDVLNVGLLGGIALMLRNFLNNGFNFLGLRDIGKGLMEQITGIFEGVTDALTAMQTNLKASALLKIAGAIAILTASVMVLSTIDSAALTRALTAMTVGFGQLIGSMLAIEKLSIGTGAFKMAALGIALILLAGAVAILSISVKSLSNLGWEELAKGLLGVTALLTGLTASTQLIAANTSGMIRAGVALIGISIALLILSKAVESFAEMGWEEMAKGLLGVGVGLGFLTTAINFMPKGMVAQGVGIIAIATGMLILAKAVESFSNMGWIDMGKGLLGVAGGLIALAIGMSMMPPNIFIASTGILVLSTAMLVLSKAVASMGSIPFGEMVKGIGALLVMLGAMSIALIMMSGTVSGAFSLMIASAALLMLSNVLRNLGELSIGQIAASLITLASVLAILGGAALLLTPLVPTLMGLGAALMLIGAGFALFGVGASMVAGAFTMLAASGRAGVAILISSIRALIEALPALVGAFALSVAEVVTELLNAAPVLIKAAAVLLTHILESVRDILPELLSTVGEIISGVLTLIRDKSPEFVQTGFEMLLALLKGIRDNIAEITNVVVDIIVNFFDALTARIPEIIDSVYDFIVAVITGVVNKLVDIGSLMLEPGSNLISGLLSGITNAIGGVISFFTSLPGNIVGWIGSVITTLFSKGVDFISGLLSGLLQKITDVITFYTELPGKILGWIGTVISTLHTKGIELIAGLLNGIIEKANEVISWFGELPGKAIEWIGDVSSKLLDIGRDFISGLLNGLAEKAGEVMRWFADLPGRIRDMIPNPTRILFDVGKGIIQGLWDGMKSIWEGAKDWLGGLGGAIRNLKGPPSYDRVMLVENGQLIMRGLWSGMKDGWNNVAKWLTKIDPSNYVTDTSLDTFNDIFDDIVSRLGDMDDFHPTITPVLDLTKVQQASRTLDDMLKTSPVVPDVSYNRARLIATTADQIDSTPETPTYTGPTEIKFEQNNYSPMPLSTNDIYRNTRSQIALAKEELDII